MPYGSGSIFMRGPVYWISYMVRGRQIRESTKSEARKDAVRLLAKRLGEVAANRAPGKSLGLTVPELLDLLQAHYIEKERRSFADLKVKIAILKRKFRGVRAAEFGSQHIEALKVAMKREKKANATVNRYLSLVRRSFKLAEQADPPLVGRVPHFEMLPEAEPRQGFITDSEYQALLGWLPEHLKGMLILGYHLGMRREALKMLRRDQVDWKAKVIRTEQAKGGKKQGRVLPIYGDMVPWMEMQMAAWGSTPNCRWILHNEGKMIGQFRKSWATACKAAGVPDLLFHDLRRSAVRNMERAGVPRSQAMAITGHRTDSVYSRYAIVSEQDVQSAGVKLGNLMEGARARGIGKEEVQ